MSLHPFRRSGAAVCLLAASALVLTAGSVASAQPGVPVVSAAPAGGTSPQLEDLGRGLVAASTSDGVFLSWRFLSQEVTGSGESGLTGSDFVVYRDGERLGTVTDSTSYLDAAGSASARYQVAAVVDGVEQGLSDEVAPWADSYYDLPLMRPAGGVTPVGEAYTYSANDMSVGDVDGDGEYEFVVKWDPSNSKDVSQRGYTGPVYIDTYSASGTLLNRIDLGVNIRAGAHYTQFLVYDFDGDGRSEMMLKTAPGTKTIRYDEAGDVVSESYVTMPADDVAAGYSHSDDYRLSAEGYYQHVVDMFLGWSELPEVLAGNWPETLQEALVLPGLDPLRAMDYPLSRADAEEAATYFIDQYALKRSANNKLREFEGFIVDGPEYLTVFDGATGAELQTIDYTPDRYDDGLMWGDYAMVRIEPGNRVDRFLATVAYLDGEKPAAVFARGYYTRATLASYTWDGTALAPVWNVDSGWAPMSNPFNDGPHGVEGTDPVFGTLTTQGFHSLSSADVDGDGKQEIVYGSATIDHDGQSMLYSSYDVLPAGSASPGTLAKLGHGDAMHVTDIDPDRPGLEIFTVHEGAAGAPYGYAMRDAKTGEVLYGAYSGRDTGRGMIGDVDPSSRGMETWGIGMQKPTGEALSTTAPGTNMSILWAPDLTRQIVNGAGTVTPTIDDWASRSTLLTATGTLTNNGTKGNPSLVADVLGDWREELLVRTADSSAIRIYTATTVTDTKMFTLMHDPQYRAEVARQQTTYNQPSYVGFYLASDMTAADWAKVPVPVVVTEPVLAVAASHDESVSGELVTLTATVGSSYPATPSGEVELVVDGEPSGISAELVDGAAIFDVPAQAVGGHELSFTYVGDVRHSAASSDSVPLTVVKGQATVELSIGRARAATGAVVVEVVPVAPAAGTPSGSITATVDGLPVEGVLPLTEGAAAVVVTAVAPGEHALVVTYSGDGAFDGATSRTFSVVATDDGAVVVPEPEPTGPTDPGVVPGAPSAPAPSGSGAATPTQQPSPVADGKGGLAATGADVLVWGATAFLLLGAGAVLVRRRRASAPRGDAS